MTTAEEFWERYTPEPTTGCWLWTGALEGGGYGSLLWRGRVTKATRVALELTSGPIGEGLLVLHRCDAPACINPAHLYAGTQRQNMADRERRRRRDIKGERNGSAKLTAEVVREIRKLYRPGKAGLGLRSLARRYGVSHPVISAVVRRETWQHVTEAA